MGTDLAAKTITNKSPHHHKSGLCTKTIVPVLEVLEVTVKQLISHISLKI